MIQTFVRLPWLYAVIAIVALNGSAPALFAQTAFGTAVARAGSAEQTDADAVQAIASAHDSISGEFGSANGNSQALATAGHLSVSSDTTDTGRNGFSYFFPPPRSGAEWYDSITLSSTSGDSEPLPTFVRVRYEFSGRATFGLYDLGRFITGNAGGALDVAGGDLGGGPGGGSAHADFSTSGGVRLAGQYLSFSWNDGRPTGTIEFPVTVSPVTRRGDFRALAGTSVFAVDGFANVDITARLVAILLPDGRTPEQAGFTVSLFSGMPSPNIPPNQAPTVTCPEPVVADCNLPGENSAELTLNAFVDDLDDQPLEVTWKVNGKSLKRVTLEPESTAQLTHVYTLGVHEVSITVDDGTDSVECQTTVTVADMSHPVVFCVEDVTVGTDLGRCTATGVVLPRPEVSDNCSVLSMTNDAPEEFPHGTTVVTWTITDAGGHTARCTQRVTVIDDERPTAAAPPDITVAHDAGDCVASNVALGSPTVGDNCGVVEVVNNAPEVFPLGETNVVWFVYDAGRNVAMVIQRVTVTNAGPVADAGADRIIECESPSGTAVRLDGSRSSDPDSGDVLTFQWSAAGIMFDDARSPTPTATFPIGSTTVTLVVADQCGAIGTANVIITVEDTHAPEITAIVPSKDALWPPTHQMIPVALAVLLRDGCTEPQFLRVTGSVRSNEVDDFNGDGSFTGDVNGADAFSAPVSFLLEYDPDTGAFIGALLLRAERNDHPDGRKYSITVTAEDPFGNRSTSTAVVVVPRSQAGGRRP